MDYHEIIYDVYHCAPQILSGVVPYLTGELLVIANFLVTFLTEFLLLILLKIQSDFYMMTKI